MNKYIRRKDVLKIKSDMMEILVKREKEGYGTTLGECNDMIFDKIRNMPTLTESEICERFAERLKDKYQLKYVNEQRFYQMIDETLKEMSDSN